MPFVIVFDLSPSYRTRQMQIQKVPQQRINALTCIMTNVLLLFPVGYADVIASCFQEPAKQAVSADQKQKNRDRHNQSKPVANRKRFNNPLYTREGNS